MNNNVIRTELFVNSIEKQIRKVDEQISKKKKTVKKLKKEERIHDLEQKRIARKIVELCLDVVTNKKDQCDKVSYQNVEEFGYPDFRRESFFRISDDELFVELYYFCWSPLSYPYCDEDKKRPLSSNFDCDLINELLKLYNISVSVSERNEVVRGNYWFLYSYDYATLSITYNRTKNIEHDNQQSLKAKIYQKKLKREMVQ